MKYFRFRGGDFIYSDDASKPITMRIVAAGKSDNILLADGTNRVNAGGIPLKINQIVISHLYFIFLLKRK